MNFTDEEVYLLKNLNYKIKDSHAYKVAGIGAFVVKKISDEDFELQFVCYLLPNKELVVWDYRSITLLTKIPKLEAQIFWARSNQVVPFNEVI